MLIYLMQMCIEATSICGLYRCVGACQPNLYIRNIISYTSEKIFAGLLTLLYSICPFLILKKKINNEYTVNGSLTGLSRVRACVHACFGGGGGSGGVVLQ